jgi:aspartate dehydrogenase
MTLAASPASSPLRVGVVGLGVIGREVCRALDEGIDGLVLAGAVARDPDKADAFLRSLSAKPPCLSIGELIAGAELLVEASTQAHLREWAPRALEAGRTVMVLSCGALIGRDDWIELARAHGGRILVPSGAIGGLDAVKGARVGRITAVTMETRKPPAGLAGAPYLAANAINVMAVTEPTLIFEGPATEAVAGFPANVNVVAALSLAGVGPERTTIKIYAVPGLGRNSHRITVEGEHGRVAIEIENVPSENPRTGRLSYLSAIAMLRDLGATLRVGT